MGFTGLSPEERGSMLKAAGVENIDELFSDIPARLQVKDIKGLPAPLSEIEIEKLAEETAGRNTLFRKNFAGAGAYSHHVPAAVDEISSRSEFYTSYTPYQPEVSQGTLAAIFEFQTMISMLTAMDVTNASLYDGATAMAEAAMMAARVNGLSRVLVSRGVHPAYRHVLRTYAWASGLEVVEIPLADGVTDLEKARLLADEKTSSVIIQSPNFTGIIEETVAFSGMLKESPALLIAVVTEGISLGLLRGPGEYGADIVCGEVQSFGNPLNFGGPYAGYISTRNEYVRKMPGRLVGRTVDAAGNRAFALTLQTREQHIRREKATSNICTNEGLVALRAAVYLSLMGPALRGLALLNHNAASYLKDSIAGAGVETLHGTSPFFNEFVIRPRDASAFCSAFRRHGINPGFEMGRYYDEYRGCVLVCATELISQDDAEEYAAIIRKEGI